MGSEKKSSCNTEIVKQAVKGGRVSDIFWLDNRSEVCSLNNVSVLKKMSIY